MAAGPATVAAVDFHLAGGEENRRKSHATITSFELHTAPGGPPVPGGIYDQRMGTTDHGLLCLTCLEGKRRCFGHAGSLELRLPLTQPIGTAEIRRWLRVACHTCGASLVDVDRYRALPPAARLAQAAQTPTEGKTCAACGATQPRVVKDEEDGFSFRLEAAGRPPPGAPAPPPGARLFPAEIRRILGRVPDALIEALGRAPGTVRALVLDCIVVSPNTVRPGVKNFGGGGGSYHDQTNLLQHLVKRNGLLPAEAPAELGEETKRLVLLLEQLYYEMILGSSSTSAMQGNSGRRGIVAGSRQIASILRNLARKQGRIRMNLLGKRVFCISRSTISGNSSFLPHQVGVPLAFARILPVEETVQAYNLARLTAAFLNGRRQYPGCTQVKRRATGEIHDVAGLRGVRLEIGDVVWRDVVDGDLAFFNRQPTLERSSIGVHEIVILRDPGDRTLQMNVVSCSQYNADFDGDQMNLWVARGPAARAEASLLSAFEGAFLSMKNGAPVNGQVQDSIVGSYALTREGVELDKYHAMQLLARARVEPPRFDQARYTGREVVGLLFRRTPFDLARAPSSFSDVFAPYVAYAPGETRTVFEGGRLVRGVLDKATVGEKAVGGVFHLIAREYGPRAALGAVYSLQQAALQFLLWRGFSIATADLLPGPEARARIRELVSGVRLEADAVSARLLRGEIVPPIGSSVLAFYESLQLNALKIPEAEVLRWILEGVRPESNGLFQMVATGSKGSVPNMIHIGGGIGQTTINGERLAELFAFGRALPYFPRFSTDPAARGFVANSYVTGMNSVEFIGQAQNGRFDLINKALSTASTGYFARKGVMNNQSTIVGYAFQAAKDGRVVMFLYGDTGLDPRELEAVVLLTVELDDAALEALAGGPAVAAAVAEPGPAGAAAAAAVARALAALRADRDAFRAAGLRLEGGALEPQGAFGPGFRSPVNVARLVAGVLGRPGREPPPPPGAAALAARLEAVEALAAGLGHAYTNEARAAAGAPPSPPHAAGAARVGALVRAALPPGVAAGLSAAELGWLDAAVRNRFGLSLMGPGTAVGVLAAQALSEPLTQYMLDSHHRSVGGGTSKSGLVRVQEIYGARGVAAEASPRMLLPLRRGAGGAEARAVANRLEHVTLRRFVAAHAVLLEPPGALRFPGHAADAAWLAEFAAAHPLLAPPADLTNWCYRFVLSRAELVLKAVALADVVRALRRAFEGRAFVAHTAEAVPEIVIRVWLRPALLKGAGPAGGAGLAEAFLDAPVRGVAGIVRAEARTVTRSAVAPGGGLAREEVAAVETFGTNLFHAALVPEVDPLRSVSSSVGDTYRLFGVEAARAKIVSETMSFMASGAPNAAHLYVYASEMTRTGAVSSVERGGLGAREPNNVLLRMAYGAPVQVVSDAALAGTRAPVYGLAAPQLLGAAPRVGSTYSRFAVNEAFVAANSTTVEDVLDSL